MVNQESSPDSGDGYGRIMHCNDPDDSNYAGNAISTTKYTAANFIPNSLFEQFRRVADLFFLVVACISFTPLAPYRAVNALLPLFVVVGETMAKEAIEDLRRKQQDIEINNQKVKVFDGDNAFNITEWQKLLDILFQWGGMSFFLLICFCFLQAMMVMFAMLKL